MRETDSSSVSFLAFARVYSGSIRSGDEVWVIGPKYDPALSGDNVTEDNWSQSNLHISRTTLGNLYILLGRLIIYSPIEALKVCFG